MPANLTPQYQKAEQSYRKAQSCEEEIDCLQEMLKLIPKHKGTEKLQADLKSKLKEARSQRQAEKKAPKKGLSYRIGHQGFWFHQLGQLVKTAVGDRNDSQVGFNGAERVISRLRFSA